MKQPPPVYLFRSEGPILKIAQAGNGYWRLFVGEFGGDVFDDCQKAAVAAAEKRSGFAEWDEKPHQCPANLEDWERI